MEDLREYCIWKGFKNHENGGKILIFEYIQRMHELCENRFDEDCFKMALDVFSPGSKHASFVDRVNAKAEEESEKTKSILT